MRLTDEQITEKAKQEAAILIAAAKEAGWKTEADGDPYTYMAARHKAVYMLPDGTPHVYTSFGSVDGLAMAACLGLDGVWSPHSYARRRAFAHIANVRYLIEVGHIKAQSAALCFPIVNHTP